MAEELIKHISDTARWIAGYRAQETNRSDAIFKDHLAAVLAGEEGLKMAEQMPHAPAMAFAMVMRTAAIDRLVMIAIKKGIDTVINLGAGLDTRPYRMALPADLLWIEIDYDHVIEYKNKQLSHVKPVCRLERIPCDLAKEAETISLFKNLGARTKSALIITEGLIGYLTNNDAATMAKNLHDVSSFRYWIQDTSQGRLRRNRQSKDLFKKLKNTPIKFTELNPVKFFGSLGWTPAETIGIMEEANRHGRQLPVMLPWSLLIKLFPGPIYKLANKTYSYIMYEKQSAL